MASTYYRLMMLFVAAAIFALVASASAGSQSKQLYFVSYNCDSVWRMDVDTLEVQPVLWPAAKTWGFAIHDCKMYWTEWVDADNDSSCTGPQGFCTYIKRCDLDGSNMETLVNFTPPPWGNYKDKMGLAIDSAAGKMYWCEGQQIFRANLDGSNMQALCSGRGALALNLGAGTMYWPQNDIGIQRANMDGTNPQTLIPSARVRQESGLSLDLTAGKVYWTERDNSGENIGEIWRANLDGSSPEIVLGNLQHPEHLLVDAEDGKMYWGLSGHAALYRANLDGSAIEHLAIHRPVAMTMISEDLDSVCGPPDPCPPKTNCSAVEAIYWTTTYTFINNAAVPGKVWRANPDGTNVHAIAEVPPANHCVDPHGIAVSDVLRKVFFVAADAVYRCNLDGSGFQIIHQFPLCCNPCSMSRIALDSLAQKVYFVRTDSSNLQWVYRSNLDGSALEAFVPPPAGIGRMRVDAQQGKIYMQKGADTIVVADVSQLNPPLTPVIDSATTISFTDLDVEAGKLYYFEEMPGLGVRSMRANLDGTNIEELGIHPNDNLGTYHTFAAIDFASQRMYSPQDGEQGRPLLIRSNINDDTDQFCVGCEHIVTSITEVALLPAPDPCPADITGDTIVNVSDLLAVVAAWGQTGKNVPADINNDNIVNVSDLLAVISAWGPCP